MSLYILHVVYTVTVKSVADVECDFLFHSKHLLTHDPVKGKALSEMVEDSGLTVVSLAALQGELTIFI